MLNSTCEKNKGRERMGRKAEQEDGERKEWNMDYPKEKPKNN